MRKSPIVVLAALLLAALSFLPAHAGVFLSELCDPASNYQTDRFIEIYNSGPNAVDLTGWSVVAVANSADVLTWTLSGSIASGQAKVCGYTAPTTVFTVNFPSASWNATSASGAAYNWNGQIGDGAKLKDASGTVIDIVVATGTLFKDADMVRIASVSSPNATYTPSEWTITAVTLATSASPGSHNGSAPPAGGPTISNIAIDPLAPAVGDPVNVQADVVDTSGVNAVTLAWGTSSGSLTNVIGMPLVSGSTYRTSSAIPGMTGGASVFYRVQAEGGAATTTSSTLSYTIPGSGGGVPPSISAVAETGDSTLLVTFSEPVESVTSQTPSNYAIGAIVPVAAVQDGANAALVTLTVRGLTSGSKTLSVSGVADLTGDIAYGVTKTFTYVDVTIPAGYYATAIGLRGSALRVALNSIIKNHTVISYSGALTAFGTTDIKPNGKIWDMYSDVPGGTPPYEYSFGETGQGAGEGYGYNREHAFPQSWFNGASPMYSDLWILYPTDSYVNNRRSNYAFGEVGTATWTSLNGSRLGSSASAGYTGTVFEPIDAYKGDFARTTMYVATRYLGQDASWPGGPESDGANLYPWAAQQYLAWSIADPVSWKEKLRNAAVYSLQHNRNPFIDHPEFAILIYDSTTTLGVESPKPAPVSALRPNSPNPFSGGTDLAFDLARSGPVALRVFDVSGRLVRTLADGRTLEAGTHRLYWDGRDESGTTTPAGLYFAQLQSGPVVSMQRLVRVR